jgi:hypothetical protein
MVSKIETFIPLMLTRAQVGMATLHREAFYSSGVDEV